MLPKNQEVALSRVARDIPCVSTANWSLNPIKINIKMTKKGLINGYMWIKESKLWHPIEIFNNLINNLHYENDFLNQI